MHDSWTTTVGTYRLLNLFLQYMSLTDLVGDKKDTKDFWQMAELLALLRKSEATIDFSKCDENGPVWKPIQFPSTRRVAPVCNARKTTF